MNTFKTAVVLATLLGVGYGVHVVLNKPLPNGSADALQSEWMTEIPVDNVQPPELKPVGTETDDSIPTDSNPSHALNDPPDPNRQSGTDAGTANAGQPGLVEQAHFHADPNDSSVGSHALAGAAAPLDAPPAGGTASYESSATSPPPYPTAPSTSSLAPVPQTDSPPADGLQQENFGVGFSVNPSAFDEVWRSAQSQLAAGDLANALFTLSTVYNDSTLTASQRDQLVPLLDQLAGTVIYSQQHLLEAPYSVQPGDTLALVAQNFRITPRFLARVNGLSTDAFLTGNQQLKVVRGPFRAELNLQRRELTLFLGRYYAGRFSVAIGRDLPANVSQLEVVENSGPRPYRDQRTGQEIPAGMPNNPYGDHWLGLRDPGQPNHVGLGIHATGQAVEASDTRGCISLSSRDAADLRMILDVGASVTVLR